MDTQILYIIITAVIGLYFPINQYFNFDKAKQKIIADQTEKEKFYRETILYLWLIAGGLALILFLNPVAGLDLGFKLDLTIGFLLISIIILSSTVYLYKTGVVQSKNYEKLKKEYQNVRYILPDTKKQFNLVILTSITAGITEEFIFRSYMFWFFAQYMEWYWSILALNLVFSLCHVWSGQQNMFGAFSLGIILSLLYYFSDSIYPVMFAHAVGDIYSGRIGFALAKYETSIKMKELLTK